MLRPLRCTRCAVPAVQVLRDPSLIMPGEPYDLKGLPACAGLPNNLYCSYCNPLTADRLTCITRGEACYMPFQVGGQGLATCHSRVGAGACSMLFKVGFPAVQQHRACRRPDRLRRV